MFERPPTLNLPTALSHWSILKIGCILNLIRKVEKETNLTLKLIGFLIFGTFCDIIWISYDIFYTTASPGINLVVYPDYLIDLSHQILVIRPFNHYCTVIVSLYSTLCQVWSRDFFTETIIHVRNPSYWMIVTEMLDRPRSVTSRSRLRTDEFLIESLYGRTKIYSTYRQLDFHLYSTFPNIWYFQKMIFHQCGFG